MERVILSHFKNLDSFRIFYLLFKKLKLEGYFYYNPRRTELILTGTPVYYELHQLEGVEDEYINSIYLNNHPVGLAVIYFDIDFTGLTQPEKTFKFYSTDGKVNGLSMHFDSENHLENVSFYKNGTRDGLFVVYTLVGDEEKILFIENFKHGTPEDEIFYDYERSTKTFTHKVFQRFGRVDKLVFEYKLLEGFDGLKISEEIKDKNSKFVALYHKGELVDENFVKI